jgi:hypothetical protein
MPEKPQSQSHQHSSFAGKPYSFGMTANQSQENVQINHQKVERNSAIPVLNPEELCPIKT